MAQQDKQGVASGCRKLHVAAEAAKEQYVQLLKNCGVAPRCSNTPLSLVPHTDDAITSKLFGIPDVCLSLFKSLEKLAPAFWAFEFSDLSTCLVQVMAICLAQGCMFRDLTMNSRMADGQGVRIPQNLTCSLPRTIYSASRPLREPSGTVKTALNCARDVAETFTEVALSNQGLIGHSVSNAFAARFEEVCENALTVNRFHDDPPPLQPSTHTIEFADIETGSLDYINCISLCSPHVRVRRWAHNTGAMQVCRLCSGYIVGDVGKPQCSEDHRPWPCLKWTHEYAMTIRSMTGWLWYRRSNAGSSKEAKPVLRASSGIVRNPEPNMQRKPAGCRVVGTVHSRDASPVTRSCVRHTHAPA